MNRTYFQQSIGILLGFFFFLPVTSFSQDQVIPKEFIGVEQGLPHGQLFDLIQDSIGFLWLGSMDGLIKYDGNSFSTFSYNPDSGNSLSNSMVLALVEDKQRRIWVGTAKGLDIYDREKDSIYHCFTDSSSKNSIPSNHILSLYADSAGNIWIGTDAGFAVWVEKENRFYRIQAKQGSGGITHVRCFQIAQNGQMWAGAVEGLVKVDASKRVYTLLSVPLGTIILKDFITIYGIQEDSSGILWLATHNGLRMFDPESQEFQLFPLPPSLRFRQIRDLHLDHSENLWLSFGAKGLVFLPINPSYNQELSQAFSFELLSKKYLTEGIRELTDDRSNKFYLGKEGYLWYGSYNGLGKIDLFPHRFPHYAPVANPKGLSNLMRTVYQDPLGGIWMQNYDTDVFYAKKLGQLLQKIPNQHPHGHRVVFDCYFTDADSLLWIGTGSIGLLLYDLRLKKFLPPPLKDYIHVYHMEADTRDPNSLWMGTHQGLVKINRKTLEITWYYPQESFPDLKSNQVLKFSQEKNGRIWMHLENYSTGKLGYFDLDRKSFQVVNLAPYLPTGLNEMKIRGIATIGDSTLWFGGGFGLGKLSLPTQEIQIFTKWNGLAENTFYGLVVDKEGIIWMKHLRHISRFDPYLERFTHYPISPSMKEMNTLGGTIGRDGKIFFNGNEGFYAFDPNLVKKDSFQAHLVLTGIEVNNKAYSSDSAPEFIESIKLQDHERALTLHFVYLNYKENKNQYRYRLKGVDKEWIGWNSEGKASYTKLDPGSYVFEAQARNGDLVEGKEILRIKVDIAYPWYQQTWALFLFALFFLVTIIIIYRFQLSRQLARREAEKLRTLTLSQSRFFAHISHELRTPLTLIQGMAQKVEEHPKRFLKEGIHLIRNQTHALSELVEQMLDLGKSEQGVLQVNWIQTDIILFIRQHAITYIYMAQQEGLTFEAEVSPEHLEMDFDPDKLGKIISNLLGNAIKFTPQGGEVRIRTYRSSDSYFQIEVSDTGIGITPKDLERIFDPYYQVDDIRLQRLGGVGIGLSLVKEYVQLLGGEIEVKSQVDEGSTFLLTFPIHHDANKRNTLWKGEYGHATVPDESISALPTYFNPSETEILVVEDHLEIRKYLNLLLSPTYKLRFASNGEEGLDQARKYIPDLIISDVMMPKMDGLEFLEALRKDMLTSHIPVLILTAKGDTQTRFDGFEKGAEAFLTKPFNEKELPTRIRSLLQRQKALQHYYHQPGFIPQVRLQDKLEREFLKNLNSILDNHLDETDYSVDKLSKEIGMSRPQLYRKVKAITDRSIELYIRSYKIFKARQLLQTTDLRIDEVTDMLGFSSSANFSKAFKKEVGVSPSGFRKQFALK